MRTDTTESPAGAMLPKHFDIASELHGDLQHELENKYKKTLKTFLLVEI
jgi:hypothetical protein